MYAGNYDVPPLNASSPLPEPLVFDAVQVEVFAEQQIEAIIASSSFEGNCSKVLEAPCDLRLIQCIASIEVAKFLALTYPKQVPTLLINLCKKYKFSDNTTCELKYSAAVLGPYLAQIVARMDVSTGDMQTLCALQLGGFFPLPKAVPIDESKWFSKPKPASANIPPKDSGKIIRIIHISDTHLDSRYTVGAEGNCTDYSMCCRIDSVNSASPQAPLRPAARYGDYGCDVPGDLMLSMARLFLLRADLSLITCNHISQTLAS